MPSFSNVRTIWHKNVPVAASNEAETVSPAIVPALPQLPTAPGQEWIEDEQVLRDEGVLFGLSDSDPAEKVAAIHHHFNGLLADVMHRVQTHEKRILELDARITDAKADLTEMGQKKDALFLAEPPKPGNMTRIVMGLLAATTICFFNFYLVYELLRPHFQHAVYISIGVLVAGLFHLFRKRSFFYTDATRDSAVPTWKYWLEEAALPLAAAGFVSVWAANSLTGPQVAATFVFLFGLFLLGGKLLLSNLTALPHEWVAFRRMQAFRNNTRKSSQLLETDIAVTQVQLKNLVDEQRELPVKLADTAAERDRIMARRDTRIKLFESEFRLSRQFRSQLTEKQVKSIVNGYAVSNGSSSRASESTR